MEGKTKLESLRDVHTHIIGRTTKNSLSYVYYAVLPCHAIQYYVYPYSRSALVGKLIFGALFAAALSSGKKRRRKRDESDDDSSPQSQISSFILGLVDEGTEEGGGPIGERR